MNDIIERTERELLGSFLIDNAHFYEAAQRISAEDYGLTSHAAIHCAFAFVINAGGVADLVSVAQRLSEVGELARVGGYSYLSGLDEGLMRTRPNVKNFVEPILAASLRRKLNRVGESLVAASFDPTADPQEAMAFTEERLLEIRADSAATESQSISQLVPATMAKIRTDRTRKNELLGLTSGIKEFDELTRGLQHGEVTAVGAGAGAGKTSFALQIATANLARGIPAQIFSLEMSSEAILRRMLALVSGVPFIRVRDPRLANASELADLEKAAGIIAQWPLHIEDGANLTISQIIAKSRLAVRRYGVKLILVDYIQIIGGSGRDERLKVSGVSRALTSLAKTEDVPIVALSQLARPDRSSPNRKPRMSDLRESSQLENDAHVVVLLHREFDEQFGKLTTNGELIIAKQRSGETGAFPIIFDKRSLTFRAADVPQRVAA